MSKTNTTVRIALLVLFAAIFLCMTGATVAASVDKNILDAGRELWQSLWFRATLLDAYCGFITFYVWVAYKERSFTSRIMWLVLIMGLGNLAMSLYVLIQLATVEQFDVERLLLRAPGDKDSTAILPDDNLQGE